MKKRKKTKRSKKPRKEIVSYIYNESWKAADKIVELTNSFCLNHLNEDYRELCEEMIAALLNINLPLEKGRPASWASGIVYALGRVNFLQDPGQSPHMTSAQIAEGFGVSQAAMRAKAKIIREELDLIQLHPDWCIPAMLEDNPLVWMLKVNGLVMDIRTAPRGAQEEAYRLGLIPYIPGNDTQPEPELQSGTGAKIIEFPSGQNENAIPKTTQKPKDDGPNLFDGLEG